ncbi:MAG: hypothetical protein ACXIUQ_16435 [Cecembia sp.]
MELGKVFKRLEIRDKNQETRIKRQEPRDKNQETRTKRQETRDEEKRLKGKGERALLAPKYFGGVTVNRLRVQGSGFMGSEFRVNG